MKKIITLIDRIDYDTKYLEHKSKDGELHYLDGNNIRSKCLRLERVTYTSEDIVHIDSELTEVSNEVTESFKQTFIDRGREATTEQVYFANETAKIVLGKSKDDKIIIDPAPCGFGKSTIKLELMKYFTKLYENESTTKGIIICGDRLADLKQLQKDLGEYKKYTYLLEGWNQEICRDSSKKTSEAGMCRKCIYTDCKVKKQMFEQKEKPILLITNMRLKEFGESICDKYIDYDGGERKILLIDEKPQIFNTVEVSKALLNEIDTAISNAEYENMKDKTELSKYWKEIIDLVESKMSSLREVYKRFIISNSCNIGVCTDNEPFMKLWRKYMKFNYSRELKHIHEILTKGGFYVCESKTEFISTIGYNNLREMYKAFDKVVIFDGSALYDPEYLALYDYGFHKKDEEETGGEEVKEKTDKGDLRFLHIPNTRTYENLHIKAYTAHKLTKTEFNNKKKYLVKAVSEFIKDKLNVGFHAKNYVVTYQQQAGQLGQFLGDSIKHQVPKMNDGKSYYFGNTKGSNAMDECTRMFSIGWDTLSDHQVAIKYLSSDIKLWEGLLELCKDRDKAIFYSDKFLKKNRNIEEVGNHVYSGGTQYCFGWNDIDEFQYLDMVSKFYQEIHRTKLRDYNYQDDIDVYVFQTKNLIYHMIECLLPKCSIKYYKDTLPQFQRAKDEAFTKADGTKTDKQKVLDWLEKWNGEEIKVSKLRDACEITSKRWEKIKQEDSIKIELDKCIIAKKGYYSRITV